MALGLVPKILNPVDVVVAIDILLKVIDSIVFKFRHIEDIVGRQPIRVHNTIGMYLGVDDLL
ncbi:hypothetical protein AWY79_12380 [Pseudodesulfovibrio indicus]|uniref:DUF1232 domain-containing protein n=1 Tax=Pseudodesulfovibrio indicus TaxID=1716143 RepID=A0ABN4LZC1_9BACT|nr:hypothetical protein AWY79_12380 [Pseudodesulfovibrio indicus]